MTVNWSDLWLYLTVCIHRDGVTAARGVSRDYDDYHNHYYDQSWQRTFAKFNNHRDTLLNGHLNIVTEPEKKGESVGNFLNFSQL